MLKCLEFFAGSGLVRAGISPSFQTVWANDICPKKRAIYIANHGSAEFQLADIRSVNGADVPIADMAWASFPCQDLSLAGGLGGMSRGTRSGLFWEWIRVLSEMKAHGTLPPVLVAENVVGFLVAEGGRYFREALEALSGFGYRVGSVVIDASMFVAQSRSRAFVIAVANGTNCTGFTKASPSSVFHPKSVQNVHISCASETQTWWHLPLPEGKPLPFSELCDRDAPCDLPEKTERLIALLGPLARRKLDILRDSGGFFAGTAYRRTRPDDRGKKVQRLEVRFDGVAGCLRTPNGGSSRQTVLLVDQGKVSSRLLTPRECAKLMGAPDYRLEGSYNDCYRAMGDAVAVPVTRWLTQNLLAPLAVRSQRARSEIKVGRSHFHSPPVCNVGGMLSGFGEPLLNV